MGCCCKRRNGEKEEPLFPDEDKKEKSLKEIFRYDQYKAKILIKLLISDDKYYRHLYPKINEFNDVAFENFFKANIDFFENTSYYNDIIIENEREFKFLLFKMEDFQSIFIEWYKDELKHLYIKKLWEKNLCISKLYKKDNNELESIYQSIFENSEDDIKYELKSLISNAPESKAGQVSNYLRNNYEEFYSLMQASYAYKKGFEQSSYDKQKTCEKKVEDMNGKVVKSLMPLLKDIVGDKLDFLFAENGGLFNSFLKELTKNVSSSNTSVINISYDTILTLANKFKNNKHLIDIIKGIKDYYNNPLGAIVNLALSFYNLCTSVKSFYDHIIDYRQKKTKYTERLREIHQNFERHKNEIKKLDFNYVNEALKKIIFIGNEIQSDQNDIIMLINEISIELEKVNSSKTKSAIGTASGVIGVLSGIVGFVVTGGTIAFLYGAAVVANAIAVGINSADIVNEKKQIKEYEKLLTQSYNKYYQMQKELEGLRNLYENLNSVYIPVNVND